MSRGQWKYGICAILLVLSDRDVDMNDVCDVYVGTRVRPDKIRPRGIRLGPSGARAIGVGNLFVPVRGGCLNFADWSCLDCMHKDYQTPLLRSVKSSLVKSRRI